MMMIISLTTVKHAEIFFWSAWYFYCIFTAFGFSWQTTPISDFTEIHPVGATLIYVDKCMDRHDEWTNEWMTEKCIGAFCDHTRVPNKWSFLFCSLTYSQDAQHLYASAADGSVVIWEGGGGTGSKGMSKTPKFLNLTSLWGMLKWLKSRIYVVDVGIVDPEFRRNICYISLTWYNNFEYTLHLLLSYILSNSSTS